MWITSGTFFRKRLLFLVPTYWESMRGLQWPSPEGRMTFRQIWPRTRFVIRKGDADG
jgi:hypothetical protein